jgi:nitroreductase
MEPVDKKIIDGIYQFLEDTKPLYPEIAVRIKIYPEEGQKVRFSGFRNVTAPHYLVLYTEKKERSERNAGYLIQQIALYLTGRGVGSCCQGMVKKQDRKLMEDGFVCAMVMAFGYPKTSGKVAEKGTASRRRSLEELCVFKNQPKAPVHELLEAARLAPSSFNSQPWRFVVYENRFHIFSKKPAGARLGLDSYHDFNFGILLANICEAAEELWIDVDLIRLENMEHMEFPNNQYVISVLLK